MNKKIKGKKLNNSLDKEKVVEVEGSNDFSVRGKKIRQKRKKNTISFTQVINKDDIKDELEKTLNDSDKIDSEEVSLDKEAEQEESISIFVIVLILAICFIVGISLGYLLYKIAIDSSAVVMVRNLLG